MDLEKQFATDSEAELNGAWIPGIGKKGEYLIARAGNPRFTRELTKEIEDNQETLDGKDDAADRCSDEIMGRVMSKTILLGWRGEVKFGEQSLTYSQGVAAAQLTAMKDFRDWVNKKSNEREHFRKKVEKAAGNA